MNKTLITLTEDDKKRIEKIHLDDYEWDWYGMDALAHVMLMKKAKEYNESKKNIGELASQYNITIHEYGLRGSLEPFRKDIYIPERFENNTIEFFSPDYGNRMNYWPNKEDRQLGQELTRRIWSFDDLENPEIIEKGLYISRLLWDERGPTQVIVQNYIINEIEAGRKQETKDHNINDSLLIIKLAEYYTNILNT